ncbi:UDP-glucuronosyltransferase 2A3 [Orchesella cincta]|uniref:UDP-glucuronosyltransferase 2A3 n=1 Tax=Orchesella cincta TaxID=48709 RepID=A0A1D2N1E1_ORCCI|nr:UDP-glucuronosyltransferase 2A3 [Orchesella cincta]
MRAQKVCFCFSLLLSVFSGISVSGSNILFFHAVATASHKIAIWPLAERLADAGHNVTYIFPVNKKMGSHPKIEELTPSKMVKLMSDFVSDFDINIRLNDKVDEWTATAFSRSIEFCEAFYDSPEIQEWLARPGLDYDLMILDTLSECGYGLVYKFKAKHITFVPVSMTPFLSDGIGIVPESSSIPDVTQKFKPSETSFMNRVRNTLMVLLWRYGYLDFSSNVLPVIESKLNLTDFPPIEEFERNTSLVLVNHHFIEDYPRSFPPMVVPISGLLCNENTHPKIKGFVTQGGRPSSQEALCFAVPLIAIPIFGDQDYNANRLESIGAAIKLDITNMSSTLLKDSIQELIQNPQ